MIRLYHPNLGVEVDAADATQAAIYRESGWVDAPEPAALPGHAPEPVTYERNADGVYRPVVAKPAKPVRKSTK